MLGTASSVECFLTQVTVGKAAGGQRIVGGVFQGQQSLVRAGQRPQNLIELAVKGDLLWAGPRR